MTDVTPTQTAAPAAPAEAAHRQQIRATAEKYETSFLSIMMQQMFEGVESGGPFGGGHGESMFKSFLTEAMAKQTARAGGVGIAAQVEREMLRMQGLT